MGHGENMTTHQDHADLPRRTMPLPGVLLDSGPILGEERARWLLGDQGSFIPRPGKKPAPGVSGWSLEMGRRMCWYLEEGMLEAVLLASSTAFSFEVVSPPAAERREVRMAA